MSLIISRFLLKYGILETPGWYIYIPNSFAYNHVYAGHIFDTTRCVKNISVKLFNKKQQKFH